MDGAEVNHSRRRTGLQVAMTCVVMALADQAAHPAPPKIEMGANLSSLRDYGSQFAFQDVFKMSRRFFTQNAFWVADGVNDWDTGVIDQIPQDADGYPLELPYYVPGTPDDVPQIVRSLMYRSLQGHYPGGHYVCLFDGTGTLEFVGVDNEVLVAPGRYEFDELDPSDGGIGVLIMSSQAGDHVRNIRIFQEQFEDTYATEVWHPDFVANLQTFKIQCLRFMEWQETNTPDPQTWADRSTPTFQTQTGGKGVAVEHMVDLCNRMGVSPWFAMPYINGDDYNMQFATYVRDHLDPGLRIYLEWGNEPWNPSFDVYDWIEANKPAGFNHPQAYASFADNLFTIWRDVFAGQEIRIIRVVGGHSSSPYQLQQALDWIFANGGGCDAGAIAQYAGADESSLTPDSTIEELRAEMIQRIADALPDRLGNKANCDAHGIPLLAYEGGQHLLPEPAGSEPEYLPLLQQMQTDPAIYEVYESLFAQWYNFSGGLWNCYSYCAEWTSGGTGKNGFWGHLRFLDDVPAETPKWQALIDHAADPCPWDLAGPGGPPDRVVDVADLDALRLAWGPNPGHPADFDVDGFVGIVDFLTLLMQWGPCP